MLLLVLQRQVWAGKGEITWDVNKKSFTLVNIPSPLQHNTEKFVAAWEWRGEYKYIW